MKLEKGKWYYMVEDGLTVVEEGGGKLSWSDDWQEIEPPVIKVIEKPKTLADVEPKVGMWVRCTLWTPGYEEVCLIVAVGKGSLCVQDLSDELDIVTESHYENWVEVKGLVR